MAVYQTINFYLGYKLQQGIDVDVSCLCGVFTRCDWVVAWFEMGLLARDRNAVN
jgi:hypothetical protein